jgi:uncharacterized membrane protein YeaQ/YmgE (transglycosylase-associated protein family)
VVGWLAALIMKRRGYGTLENLLIGVVGVFLGGYFFKESLIYLLFVIPANAGMTD